jgi:MFS family permease
VHSSSRGSGSFGESSEGLIPLMYRLDWVEQLKLRTATRPSSRELAHVHPTVWKLGFTSLLTDIASEMVNSMLPAYIVLYLHMSPLQYGAIDGIYNGIAVSLLGLTAGILADRWRRHKELAVAGYGVSAVCKLLLLAAGGAWGWITAVVAADRAGKGIRTAPRDALISLCTPRESLAGAFAVHRTLDAGGSLLGPIVAFALISRLPGAYDAVWVTSFVFALLGVAVLWLFVQNPTTPKVSGNASLPVRKAMVLLFTPGLRRLTGVGSLLSVMTIGDGFLYLILQQRGTVNPGFFPLFYVITACLYMLFSVPVGRIADRWGRGLVLLSGYGMVALIYALLLSFPGVGFATGTVCLVLFGLYYAATEGVLMAMASALVPADHRTTGLAMLATFIGIAKMASSLLFGLLWQVGGAGMALIAFAIGMALALPISAHWIRGTQDE